MFAIQVRCRDCGDEELRTIAKYLHRQVNDRLFYGLEHTQGAGEMKKTYVLGPELAIERRYGRMCGRSKFSSLNLVP